MLRKLRQFQRLVPVLLLSSTALAAYSQEIAAIAPTNLAVYRSLASRIAGHVAGDLRSAGADSVSILIQPQESAWLLEEGVISGLSQRELVPTRSASTRFSLEFSIERMRVSYTDPRRDGFLGSRVLTRLVELQIGSRIVERDVGVLTPEKSFAEQFTDTVYLATLEEIEQPGLPATRGTVPSEGFFSNLVEPIVVVAAIGVAVYLLFSVRS